MAKCMTFVKKLLKDFWAKALSTLLYLLNRLPTRAIENMTSFEAWTGMKHSVKHL